LGIAALRKGGRYVLVGLYGGELAIRCRRSRSAPSHRRLVRRQPPGAEGGGGAGEKGKLKPIPVETRAADQAGRALEDLKAGKVLGRVVLDFGSVITAPATAR